MANIRQTKQFPSAIYCELCKLAALKQNDSKLGEAELDWFGTQFSSTPETKKSCVNFENVTEQSVSSPCRVQVGHSNSFTVTLNKKARRTQPSPSLDDLFPAQERVGITQEEFEV